MASVLEPGIKRLILGGTANLAVLGGNLPPSFDKLIVNRLERLECTTSGWRVARRNGPVARSTSL